MLSTNSLSAFSAATTISSKAGDNNVRLVRDLSARDDGRPSRSTVPGTPPGVAPPRGSLLNLSV